MTLQIYHAWRNLPPDAQGLDALFIAAGIHGGETRDAVGGLDPVAAQRLLADSGAHAAYAMDALA